MHVKATYFCKAMTSFYKRSLLFLLAFGALAAFAQYDISFSIEKLKRKGKTWSFEIHAACSQPGSYLSRGQIYLGFNPEAFGYALPDSLFEVELCGPLQSTEPMSGLKRYKLLNALSYQSKLVISWMTAFNGVDGGPEFYSELSTEPQALFKVVIHTPGSAEPQFHFIEDLMRGQQFFVKKGLRAEFPYRD